MAGAGFFAQYHADAWNRCPGVTITAIADPDQEKARAFAARWGLERVYADPAEMLARERPDFLDIVTGPSTHLELTRLGAAARVAVISQKPMAPTWEDSLAMVECCEAAGVRLLVHENWRWQPWYRETKRILESGALGRVFYLGFRMRNGDGRGPEPYRVQPYFVQMKRFLIFETLVHFLDTFRFLGGELRELYCRTARINPVIAGEDAALLRLGFQSGAEGVIDANRISGPVPNDATFGQMRVEGDLGMVEMGGDGRLTVTRYGESPREHPYEIPAQGYRGDSILALHRHFAACLREGQRCESEGREYLRTVRAVFASYESAETNQVIQLS